MKDLYTFEQLLQEMEFPGEDGAAVERYLAGMNFPGKVMDAIYAERQKAKKIIPWLILALGNLGLLIFFGTSPLIMDNELATRLSVFFFLFPTIALFGSLTGLILTMDTDSATRRLQTWLKSTHIPGF